MTKTTTRRAILRGAAAAIPAAAVTTLPAIATGADAELAALWAEYRASRQVCDIARADLDRNRDAIDAEIPAPAADAAWPERDAYGRRLTARLAEPEHHRVWEAWCAETVRVDEIAAQIKATEATTIFGVAVKLTALDVEAGDEDYQSAVARTLADIDKVIGSDFAAFVTDPIAIWEAEAAARAAAAEDDEDEDEAVQS